MQENDSKNLCSLLKELKTIDTDIGTFKFVKNIGEGGNSYVYLFEFQNKKFAIKFLKNNDSNKLIRFKDEYFCFAQIPTHPNLVEQYHFDVVNIYDASYYIIIMKYYPQNLNSTRSIFNEKVENKLSKGTKLFEDLKAGLKHLHLNQIIHRDVKPQNIFIDADGNFVIGDIGIAHFNGETFPKLAQTKDSERLANFSFSAPEQVNSKEQPLQTQDLFSLGSVIQWYLTNEVIRGEGRKRFPSKLELLDKIVSKCIQNNPAARFQSIQEIEEFIIDEKKPKSRNYWKTLHCFDDVIRNNFPLIKNIEECSDSDKISKFINSLENKCKMEHMYFMFHDGGDNQLSKGIKQQSDGRWLLNDYYEFKIDKIYIYRDDRVFRDFLIINTAIDDEPTYFESSQNGFKQNTESSFYYSKEGQCFDANLNRNGYLEFNGEIVKIDDTFSFRERILKKEAILIMPTGTAIDYNRDDEPKKDLLKNYLNNSNITETELKKFLEYLSSKLHPEIDYFQ